MANQNQDNLVFPGPCFKVLGTKADLEAVLPVDEINQIGNVFPRNVEFDPCSTDKPVPKLEYSQNPLEFWEFVVDCLKEGLGEHVRNCVLNLVTLPIDTDARVILPIIRKVLVNLQNLESLTIKWNKEMMAPISREDYAQAHIINLETFTFPVLQNIQEVHLPNIPLLWLKEMFARAYPVFDNN